MDEALWIRWYIVGFFALFGGWLIVKRRRFAKASVVFCRMQMDHVVEQRLVWACQRRDQLERLPSSALAVTVGGLSLVMAILAARTRVPVALLYAVHVVALASIVAAAYTRLRPSATRRVATLNVRNPNAIAPWYVWMLVTTSALLPLLWISRAPVTSSLIAAAGVVIVVLARRVASLPALLSGDDVVVEAFVDSRLREARVLNLLSTAVAPSYVFEAFGANGDAPVRTAALAFGLLVLAVMMSRQIRRARRGPSQTEILRWLHAAP